MKSTINHFYFDKFLTPSECDYLISLKKEELKPSSVISRTDESCVLDDCRTSSGAFLNKQQFSNNEFLKWLSARISYLTRCPVENFEDFQILRYEVGQQYKPHNDYFDFASTKHIARGGQRLKTVLIYLNTPDLGGDTYFPHLHEIVAPVQGRVLVWDNAESNDVVLLDSLHGGLPVLAGEKYVLTCWIRAGAFV